MTKILGYILVTVFLFIVSCNAPIDKSVVFEKKTIDFRTQEIIAKADEYLKQSPVK